MMMFVFLLLIMMSYPHEVMCVECSALRSLLYIANHVLGVVRCALGVVRGVWAKRVVQ